jgi:type II secretory pathway component HofQ
MRFLTPAILAALMIAGCACNRPQEKPAEPAPLLQDIPLIGKTFQPAPEPAATEAKPAAATEVPLLGDIPILGHLFKRAAEQPEKK